MEQLQGIYGELSYLSGMYTAEEADFMAHLLINSCTPSESEGSFAYGVQSFWPSHESTLTNATAINRCSYYSADVGDSTNFFCFPQGTSSSGSPEDDSYLVHGNECNMEKSDSEQEKPVFPGENFETIANSETPVAKDSAEDNSNKERSAKRERTSTEMPKWKRNLKSRKSPKASASNNDEEDANTQRKSSSNYCSEEESTQQLNGRSSSSLSSTEVAAANLTGKTRASRGAATDPQSLYARKRRERINERLRILQTLVPNGTKVDISTMLEEAVQYVKFLQLQIKLLSSDDLWMYAPIAYNGMDVGLDLKVIPSTRRPQE